MEADLLPFAILADGLAALRRFHECAEDGQGYDVPAPMMKRLASIGLVRRISGDLYEHTTFGLSVLIGDFDTPAQLPASAPSVSVDEELLAALKLAVRQNEHDMLLTGEELRQCGAAIQRAMAEAALQAQGWQPIETAPKDGTAFFACLEASDIPHAMRFNEEGQLVLTWDGWIVDAHDWPTHWMPLPAPHPQGEEHGR
jgi:hypothetical protein